MVLEKLGDSLKNTLKKIAKSMFIDGKVIDEIVREIQRALLQADVNVQLVFDLSKNIKERALKEKPPAGVSQRDHLVKIVYEELVKFMGEEKKGIEITKKKPFKIMMIGLNGTGKCVHGESRIPLSDGSIFSADNLYSLYQKDESEVEEGSIINVSNKGLLVPSFNPNTLKMEHKKITHLWKLKGKELLKVSLDNGNDFNVRVTPGHPFFVLKDGKIQMIRADQLTEDDVVATPFNSSYCLNEQNLFTDLKELDLNVKYELELSKGDIKYKLMPNLKFSRNYCKFTMDLKKGIIPIHFTENCSEYLIIRLKNGSHFISFPLYFNEEMSEFLGYVIGDGHLERRYIEITNQDSEIINRIKYLSKKLFGINLLIKKDTRRKNSSLYQLILSSTTLVEIMNKLFKIPIGKKGKNLQIPRQILKSPDSVVCSFLRAYFDCDAYAGDNIREIELSSESYPLILETSYLLNRFGILSTISKKYVNGIPYWRLYLRAKYAEKYSSKIGFSIEYKKERTKNYSLIGELQGCGKQDIIPLGKSLKELRLSLGFTIGEIQQYVNSYGNYEKKGEISKDSLRKLVALYLLKKKGNLALILEHFKHPSQNIIYSNAFINGFIPFLREEGFVNFEENQIILTKKALIYLQNFGNKMYLLDLFVALVNSDVCWLKVKDIEKIKHNDFVYDLTVEDNHSFIADGIIVHNTTSIGKLAKYYSKRGFKIGAIGLDVHRPAAPKQLKQVCDAINIKSYIDEKEKDALKVYKNFEKEYSNYDVLIIDTAGRDALSKDLIEEIEKLNSYIKPDENLLVISADIGQAAQKQAEQFHKSCGVTGIVLTKMDGTAKGGGALSACSVSGAPIKFIGVGEKVDDLEEFNPKGFVSRLLGMGDIEALLEKAKEAIDEDKVKDLGKKFLKGDFNFLDLYEQVQGMKKMGSLSKIAELIPGFSGMKLPKEMLDVQDEKLEKWKFILDSCTKEELEDPEILTKSRVERIAKGAGVTTAEVRELLKQYKVSKKMMKQLGSGDPNKLMKKLSRKMGGKFKF